MPAEMTAETAETQIKTLTKWEVCPTLTQVEIDLCVAEAKRTDSTGRLTTDANWVPSWDIAAGVAFGWDLKAGNAAGEFDFAPESGQSFKRSQITEQCEKMARMWRGRMEPITSRVKTYEDLSVNTGDVDPHYRWDNNRLN